MKWCALYALAALSGCSLVQANPAPAGPVSANNPPFILFTKPLTP